VQAGIIPCDYPLFCYGISGYSGAGKAFIEEYENPNRSPELSSARMYALGQSHKHQPEMQKICGLTRTPMFSPIIDDYYGGMLVNVPLQLEARNPEYGVDRIRKLYAEHYVGGRVRLCESDDVSFLAANTMSGSDDMELYVFGDTNSERILLTARFDNLGKGASGAAVQCFELMAAERCTDSA
jgi:N-acetyl-gamma-glutamyl-phosphate reductase